MAKVFCVGFSKTGTTSFEYAMEILGYRVYHGHWQLKHNDYMMALWIHRDLEEIKRMSEYWDAFADAPWGGTDLYRDLHEWYPDAKFVLTLREPEAWYRSLERMLTEFDPNLQTALDTFHAKERYGFTHFVRQRFGISQLAGNKERIIERYQAHYVEAEEYFIRNGASYVKLDCAKEDGWKVLCPFLGRDIPAVPYPHLNAAPVVQPPAAQPAVPAAPMVQPQVTARPPRVQRVIRKLKRTLSKIMSLGSAKA